MITTETLFWTQIASIIGFVAAIFVLYRVLVAQKDATIQVLKENISFLSSQLAELRSQSPDLLAQSLATRVKLIQEELGRLQSDKTATQDEVRAKEVELARVQQLVERQEKTLVRARARLSPNHCPHCKAELVERRSSLEWPENRPKDESDEQFELRRKEIEIRRRESGVPLPLSLPMGYEFGIYHEHVAFKCGYETKDGEILAQCGNSLALAAKQPNL